MHEIELRGCLTKDTIEAGAIILKIERLSERLCLKGCDSHDPAPAPMVSLARFMLQPRFKQEHHSPIQLFLRSPSRKNKENGEEEMIKVVI